MKKFIATVTAIAASLVASPALANDQQFIDNHIKIVENLRKVGVTVIVNNPLHCQSSRAGGGSYFPGNAMLIVCQDKGKGDNEIVNWTLNDYDTLRHEAHHVVQDCAKGTLGDGRMDMLFNGKDFLEFTEGLEETVDKLYQLQREDGLSGKQAMEEVEAYIVAEYIDADSIANKVLEFCLN